MATWRRRSTQQSAAVEPVLSGDQKATDTYKVMLKTCLGPRLRELGFRGSGGVYTRPDPNFFVRIGVQKSPYSTSKHVKFTLNISAIEKTGWAEARVEEERLPEEPSANTFYGSAHWQRRIGQLMPEEDREPWWELLPSIDLEALARKVLSVIEGVALPAIENVTTKRR